MNFANLPFSFICAHSAISFQNLYDIDRAEYETIELRNGHTRCAYELPELTFSGVSGKGVLTFSQDLYDGQKAEMDENIKEFSKFCYELAASAGHASGRYKKMIFKAKLDHEAEVLRIEKYNRDIQEEQSEKAAKGIPMRGRQKQLKELPIWDEADVARELILSAALKGKKYLQHFVDVSVQVPDDPKKKPVISWSIDEEKKEQYLWKYFGKKLICTNRKDLSLFEILSTYADQECIENLFKISKNADHFSIRPQYHWTDSKIWVHVMMCLMGIAAAEVLRKKIADAGMTYTKEALIEKLCTIRDGWIIRDMKKAERVLESMDEEQQKLMSIVEKINIE